MRWRRATTGRRVRTRSCSSRSRPWRPRRPTCSSICLTCRDASPSSNSKSATTSITESSCQSVVKNDYRLPPLLFSHNQLTTISFAEHLSDSEHGYMDLCLKFPRGQHFTPKMSAGAILWACCESLAGWGTQRRRSQAQVGEKVVGSLITIKVNKERDRSLIYAIFIHSHKFI